jgi:hypothetical protein
MSLPSPVGHRLVAKKETGCRLAARGRIPTMASAAAESYQDLQRSYDQALEEYRRQEDDYRRAAAADPSNSELKAQYQRLEARRLELERLYAQVREMRDSLAGQRDEALKRASSI